MDTAQKKWIWVGMAGLFIAAALVFAVIARSGRRTQPVVSSPPEVTISMDAQGRAKIGGVTIGNTNVRDATLSMMDKLDVKAKVVVPNTMTNAQQASNFIEVLNSANRAGLFREKTNPYE